MVRGGDRPELRLQRSIHSEIPSRKDTYGVTAGEHGSHVRDKKKWRKVQRHACPASQIQVVVPQLHRQLRWECGDGSFPSVINQVVFQGGEGGHSVRIQDVSKANSGTPPDGAVEGFTGTLACGLSLWWDDSVEVQSLFSSKHIIDVILRKGGDNNWVQITGVYGTSYREDKADFWEWMSSHFSPSDIPWLCARDFNEFLWDHEKSGEWRRRNQIIKIKDDENWVEQPGRVRKLVEDHFIQTFTSGEARNWGSLLDCISPRVSEEMNQALLKPVSEDEIKTAIFKMGGLKAQGPDGFQGIFYQSYWEHVYADVCALVRELMQGSSSPTSLNATYIVLIPKVPHPETVSQFRPISLCNYSYKVLSKVLANRLKVILPMLISPSQNAFVAGRQIQDNIGIAHEMFHFLKGRTAKRKFEMGVKLDMQKAYDRVEWDFLDAVMERMGFCCLWRRLVMGCVSSVNFAVLLNGQPGNKFAPSRGLRQGDPLSPYLFIILGEVLSCMIQAAIDDKQLERVRIGVSGPIISHLFFADDTLLFLRAGDNYCRNLLSIIDRYCAASGHKVNLQKSSIYFGANVPKGVAANLGGILGVSVVDNPGTYLGVPAIWGRSKKRGLAYVKGRILGKLQGWKQSALSRAGREVLIKAVVQAIPAYPMCIFKFPTVVCQELDALVARFWWGSHGQDRKIHWVSKQVLGLPKDMGGLGFRNFQEFNVALLAKQCWRLLTEPNSLWARVIKARYFLHCSFWEAKKGAWASWAWSSLLSGRELLASGSHWQIMGGEDVRVWVDRWLPSLPSGHPMPLSTVSVSSNLRVSSLIDSSSRQWDFDFLRLFLSLADQRAIQETIIGDSRWKDRLIWAVNRNGKYSVKSGYRWLQVRYIDVRDHRMPVVRSISKTLWKCIWQLAVPQKIRHFLWVSLHLGLPTGKALCTRRLSPFPSCPLCQSADETVEHVFLRCSWVAAVWFGGALNYKVDAAGIDSWARWLQTVFSSNWGSSTNRQWFQAYVSFSCWFIWKARCDFVFNQVPINPSKVIFSLSTAFGNFLLAVSSLGIARPVSVSQEEVVVRWCPPASPFVKINVDASWSKSSWMGFAGVVARQDGGRFRAAVRSSVLAPSSLVAESFAILRGCELGASMGFSSVIIESDSLQAISYLNGSLENGSWEAFPILARAQRLGSAFQNCRWSWVPRSANLAADVLASAGLTEMCDFVWVDRPPSSLVHVLCNDGLPCPH
ncbi:uncharacterized protein [Malus domestica]|uniref:uncharacterized protein n=1 Tax=Malus domestica TaxID=3750 RepID=UPI00397516ED